jgi:hypothetical protein
MSGVSNPYRSPDSLQKDEVNGTVESSGNVIRDLICWPILFGINMIIPLLFGWSTLRDHGKAGAAAATVLLLSISLAVLLSDRVWKRRLYLGGFLVSLAQPSRDASDCRNDFNRDCAKPPAGCIWH